MWACLVHHRAGVGRRQWRGKRLLTTEDTEFTDRMRAGCSALLFVGDEVLVGFPFSDDGVGVVVDEDFGGSGAGVVVGGHRHAVGSGGEDSEEFAAFGDGEVAVFGEVVAGLADGADDVDFFIAGDAEGTGAVGGHGGGGGPDEVVGFVEGGADEVVHGGVDDDVFFYAGGFGVLDLGQKDAGIAGNGAAGLDDDLQSLLHTFTKQGNDGGGVFEEGGGFVAFVESGKTAAGVEGFDGDAVFGEFVDEGEGFGDGIDVGIGDFDGAADVEV